MPCSCVDTFGGHSATNLVIRDGAAAANGLTQLFTATDRALALSPACRAATICNDKVVFNSLAPVSKLPRLLTNGSQHLTSSAVAPRKLQGVQTRNVRNSLVR